VAAQIHQPAFGNRLRAMRAERGMSQRDLGAGVVNQSYISLLESGSRVPTLDVVMHLAKVLGVPFGMLVGDDTVGASPAGPPAAAKVQLVEELLTTSAIDHGDLAQAEHRLTEAYREAVADGAAATALGAGLALERVLELRNDNTARYELLSELLPVAEQSGVPEALVRTRIALSSAARDTGRLDEAFTQIELADREIAQTAFRYGSEHIRLLAVRVSVLSDAGGGAEIVRLVETMLAMADRLGSPAISGRTHWVASIALAGVGHTEESLEHLRRARHMLASPTTSLRDWARFSRAAVSALMDARAELSEISSHMHAARAATAAEAGADAKQLSSLEVRYAVACGEPERAIAMAADVDLDRLAGVEGVRFAYALGVALRSVGRSTEAIASFRRAAQLAESASAYRRAAQIWREVNDALSA
jgi:transcriptional regulator with XRE-family HTH domain